MVYWPPLSFPSPRTAVIWTNPFVAYCDKFVVFGSEGKVSQNIQVTEKECEKWKHILNIFVAGACNAK